MTHSSAQLVSKLRKSTAIYEGLQAGISASTRHKRSLKELANVLKTLISHATRQHELYAGFPALANDAAFIDNYHTLPCFLNELQCFITILNARNQFFGRLFYLFDSMRIERFKKEVQNRLDRFTAQGTRVGVEAGLPKCDVARRSVNNSARPPPSVPSSPSASAQNHLTISPETTNAVDTCSSSPSPTHTPVTRGSGLAVAPFMNGANISSSALNGVAGNQANVANRNGHNNTGNVSYNSYNNCIVFQ